MVRSKKDALWCGFLPYGILTYKTAKFIKVDVPAVAIFYRIMQALALSVALAQLYFNDGWAKALDTGGVVNVWDEQGTMLATTDDPNLWRSTSYCSNAANSYAFREYTMESPECEALLGAELTEQTASSLFFTTSIIETVTEGWPCALAAAASKAKRDACTAKGGATYARNTGQCGCQSTRSIYPLAVEEMQMAFEHAYATSSDFDWKGSSADPSVGADGLFSLVHYANGTKRRYEAGQVLLGTLDEWLAAANVSLEDANTAVPPDSLGRRPPRRSTGVNIRVDIEYTNRDVLSGRPSFDSAPGKRGTHADITFRAETGTWTGVGVDTSWVRYPQLPRDVPQEYELVERWRHGVLFQFHTAGQIYRFDFFYLLGVLVEAMVMMKLAAVAADAVAFYCLPNGQSTVLRNKRQELVSKKSEFAEIGMKAALAAASYKHFDPDNNGSIEAVDIVKVFAHVEGVSWQQAHAIAHMILADADTSDDGEVAGGPGGLSYVEYMTCLEGDAINFDQFLKGVTPQKDATDMEECEKAFNEERANLPPVEVKANPAMEGAEAASPAKGQRPAGTAGDALGLSDADKAARRKAKGVLTVHLIRAADLQPIDDNGKADPYVKLTSGRQVKRSGCQEETLNPEWDEQLVLKPSPLEKHLKTGLVVQLNDKDSGLFDDVIGKVHVSLDGLEDADSISFVEQLPVSGRVEFAVQWAEGPEPATPKTPKTPRSPFRRKKGASSEAADGAEAAAPEAAPAEEPTAEVTPAAGGEEAPSTKKKKKKKKDSAAAPDDVVIDVGDTTQTL